MYSNGMFNIQPLAQQTQLQKIAILLMAQIKNRLEKEMIEKSKFNALIFVIAVLVAIIIFLICYMFI